MGTRGVPARYGGFETAIEEIGSRLVQRGYEVTVYARNPGQSLQRYLGMRVVNMPALRHRYTETLSHTALSSIHAVVQDHPDVCLLMNSGNAPLIRPLQRAGIPTAIHLDGLESRRDKWRGLGAKYYKWAERMAIRWADAVVADSKAIADYVKENYGRDCIMIPYGAPVIHPGFERLRELNVTPGEYHLVVARMEPENHVLEIVHGFRKSSQHRPLLIVGDAPYSHQYVKEIHDAAASDSRIRLLGSIYETDLLDQLYAHAHTYIHGHSVGGTNPSLLRAMGAATPVLAYDVIFNREVTAGLALYWSSVEELAALFDTDVHDTSLLNGIAEEGRRRVSEVYQWDQVTDQYEVLARNLASRSFKS